MTPSFFFQWCLASSSSSFNIQNDVGRRCHCHKSVFYPSRHWCLPLRHCRQIVANWLNPPSRPPTSRVFCQWIFCHSLQNNSCSSSLKNLASWYKAILEDISPKHWLKYTTTFCLFKTFCLVVMLTEIFFELTYIDFVIKQWKKAIKVLYHKKFYLTSWILTFFK